MNPVKVYLLHFANINKFYDTCVDKKEELASRVPGCATIKNRFLLNVLWVVMCIMEPFLSIIIVTFLLPIYAFKSIITPKAQIGKHIALCYHGLTNRRIETTEVKGLIDYHLYPIFVEKGWVNTESDKHNIFELVNVLDVILAFLWSLAAIIAATVRTHGCYLYRNYLCYEYILTYKFLSRVPEDRTLYFVNHLDRWAVLFNLAPQKNKVLLQHGIEVPVIDWPIKLTTVNTAYLFAESQIESMRIGVLGHNPEYKFMPPTISLTSMPSAKKVNILIIACDNYMFYTQEEAIIKKVVWDNMMIYVKIHPGKNDYQKYEDLKNTVNPNIEIINVPTFPKVDAVVSYYSTLGLEYEMHHVPGFYYDLNSIDEIVDKIKSIYTANN